MNLTTLLRRRDRLGRLGLLLGMVGLAWSASDPDAEVLRFELRQPNQVTAAIEAQVRTATPEQLRTIESRLLRILQAPEATRDARIWACRLLRHAGSEAAAPTLGPLLADPELADAARYALQSIPGPKVDAALRAALGQVPPTLRPGVILTLGARRDPQAASLLGPFLRDTDPTVVEATLQALGNLGSPNALQAIQAFAAPAPLARARSHALLRCAETLGTEGKTGPAADLYRQVWTDAADAATRIAALRGLAMHDPTNGRTELTNALRDNQGRVRVAAASLLCELPAGPALTAALTGMDGLAPDVQLTLLAASNDPAIAQTARKVLRGADPILKLAALETLGRRGTDADVPALLAAAANSAGELQTAARNALLQLRSRPIDSTLISAAQTGAPDVRAEAMRALAGRQTSEAVPILLRNAAEADPTIATAAFQALGRVAGRDELSALLKLLVETNPPAAEAAVLAVCARVSDKPAAAAVVLQALPGPRPDSRRALLRILSTLPTPSALTTLTAAAQNPGDEADIAVKALAEWPDAAALPALQDLARGASSPTHRALAFRGCVRLVREQAADSEARLKALTDLMPLAQTPEDKKQVLGALADTTRAEAMVRLLEWLPNPALDAEASAALVRIAGRLARSDSATVRAALDRARDLVQSPDAQKRLARARLLADVENLASQGVASSPDGWEKDGEAGGDQAGIDGQLQTYWDQEDGKPLYRYVVTFKQPETLVALSLVGWAHHNHAPKDFEVLCDQTTVRQVKEAQYDDNLLLLELPATPCRTVELKITGYYGGSPAIRELGLYRRGSSVTPTVP